MYLISALGIYQPLKSQQNPYNLMFKPTTIDNKKYHNDKEKKQ